MGNPKSCAPKRTLEVQINAIVVVRQLTVRTQRWWKSPNHLYTRSSQASRKYLSRIMAGGSSQPAHPRPLWSRKIDIFYIIFLSLVVILALSTSSAPSQWSNPSFTFLYSRPRQHSRGLHTHIPHKPPLMGNNTLRLLPHQLQRPTLRQRPAVLQAIRRNRSIVLRSNMFMVHQGAHPRYFPHRRYRGAGQLTPALEMTRWFACISSCWQRILSHPRLFASWRCGLPRTGRERLLIKIYRDMWVSSLFVRLSLFRWIVMCDNA